MAMGDALAVEVAQQSHINLLKTRASCMLDGECLQYRAPIPRGPFYELLTIDDHIGLQKKHLDNSSDPSFNRDIEVFEAANAAYQDVGLTAHPGKRQRRATNAVVLGAEVDGVRGRVSAPRARIALLSFITIVLVQKGQATRKIIQGLLGCWTHILLFRRPAFSVVDALYHEGEGLHEDAVFKLSRASRNELLTLCLTAPALQTNMRTSATPCLYMMDASPTGAGICRTDFPSHAADEFWRRSEQRGYYTKLQQGPGLMLRELGFEHFEQFGEPEQHCLQARQSLPLKFSKQLHDHTIVFDCIELFSGQGNWSTCHQAAGLRVHPGIEKTATGKGFGDLFDDETFRVLATLAAQGSVREWHAAPPCWSFGTLRRPRLRSKEFPAGFNPNDSVTKSQTLLAIRTAFLLTLAVCSGCFVSCEQPGSSVMFRLHAFKRLLELGCRITRFCFCSFGMAFQKASQWLHNKPWYEALSGKCNCAHSRNHFTIEGTFTRASIPVFDRRCRPDAVGVYGRLPRPGEAVSAHSASYPLPLCRTMAAGSRKAHRAAAEQFGAGLRGLSVPSRPCEAAEEDSGLRDWFDDPEWVEDVCESLTFKELFRYKFSKLGHINCLECRTFKSWLKHCSKAHVNSRLVALLDSRVTMGAVAKGRSSSKALSRILRGSLCYTLGSGLYPGTLHCRSGWNRADGPSRDSEVPPASRPVPLWLNRLINGDHELFDLMVESATWIRPLGRWFRLLLLLAGDIERNPGPVRPQQPRGELNMLSGFAPATFSRMEKCLAAFESWCKSEAGLSLKDVLQTAETANMALKAYGLHLFRQGAPRYWLVYAITSVQQLRPEFRNFLSGAWQVDRKWQLEEPGRCRAVLSAPVLKAMLALGLLWRWWTFSGIIALGFGGMLHPNEFLTLTRRDLVFPSDSLMEGSALYIFVKNPKTARFARKQHVRVDDRSLIFLAWRLFGSLGLDEKLYPASVAVFRRQWNSLLDRLQIPRRQAEGGATPGTLRGSGATFEYLQRGNITESQWKGRWNRLRTLEHYIQEVAAQLFLFNLSPQSRKQITFFSSHLGLIIEQFFPAEYREFCKAEY